MAFYPPCKLATAAAVLFTVVLSAQALLHHSDVAPASNASKFDPGLENSFRTINRRSLLDCSLLNPLVKKRVDPAGPLGDVQAVNVTISGIVNPNELDWVAVVSPSNASTSVCPEVSILYVGTGDLASMPLLCHYPVKFKFLKEEPGYLTCASSTCERRGWFGSCLIETCATSVTFRLINIRTDTLFVLFAGGLQTPCVVSKAGPLNFANPSSPLYGHLSSLDSTGTMMRLTWVSGDSAAQRVEYADGRIVTSSVRTFTRENMCKPSAAADFGFHDPGFIHTAVMSGLSPATSYSYRYGSEKVGFSENSTFTTPPAAGADSVSMVVFGDMGKAERDGSSIHFVQPGAIPVVDAITEYTSTQNVSFVFHIGDISYATGFLVEWDSFLELIHPVASRIPYMTVTGNHERDQPLSGSYYHGTDSGGECGVPYYSYFPMPTPVVDEPWYSIESGPLHVLVMSTEHSWKPPSKQYQWIQADLASVNRSRTPWVIYTGHRPMYSSSESALEAIIPSVDPAYTKTLEPLLVAGKVDLALAGHVHNYERLCAVFEGQCLQNDTKDAAGINTYDFSTYRAPVQAVIGMAGFELDGFRLEKPVWSRVRISEFGFMEIRATSRRLSVQLIFVNGTVGDRFDIVK